MKILSTNQETARAASGHSVARFLKLGNTFYSERDPDAVFSPDASETFVPLLGSWKITGRSANKGLEELPLIQRFEFSVWISDTHERPIDEQVDDDPGGFIGQEVIAYKVMRPVTGLVTESDWIEMWRGEIEEVTEIAADHVSFLAVDFTKYKGEKLVTRDITKSLFPDTPAKNLGDTIPIIFGSLLQCPGIQVTEGAFSTLDADLSSIETDRIEVVDASVFTSTGKVQIGNEKISYTGIATADPNDALTGLTRGIEGTTASDHSFGLTVSQLESIKFLVADQVITSAGSGNPFGAAGTVKDANGAIIDIDKYTVTIEDIDGNDGTFVTVDDDGFPDITETLSNTTKLDLAEDLGDDSLTGSDWTAGGLNSGVSDYANAVDTDEDTKHVTAATVAQGDIFHVKMTKDLSGQTGEIKKALAFIEYAVLPSRNQSFPSSPQQITFSALNGDTVGNILGTAHDLGEPAERDGDTNLFSEDDASKVEGSIPLFQTTGSGIGSNVFFATRFKRFGGSFGVRQTWNTVDGPAHIDYWLLLQGLNDGDVINYSTTNVRSAVATGFTSSSGKAGPPQAGDTRLVLRLFNDGNFPSQTSQLTVEVDVTPFPLNASDSTSVDAVVFLFFPALNWWDVTTVHNLPGSETTTITATIRASDVPGLGVDYFSPSDLVDAEVQIDQKTINSLFFSTVSDMHDTMKYKVLDVRVRGVVDAGLVGQTTLLDSETVVPSTRVKQTIDITSFLGTLGWGFFDGTGTNPPGIGLGFPSQSNGFVVKIYNAGFMVETLESSTRATSPEEFSLSADCVGYTNQGDNLTAEGLVSRIFGDPFYGLNVTRLDTASLQSALDSAAQDLPTQDRDDWVVARRLIQKATNRDLLGQAITDASIRAVIEEGKLKFFPELSAIPAESVRTIDDDKKTAPVRRSTNIALVSNKVVVQYEESLSNPGNFDSEVTDTDTTAVTDAEGRERETVYQSRFIRDDTVAETWAQRAIDDFSFPRSLVSFTLPGGRDIDLEVGDPVTLSDSYTRFRSQALRITSISPASGIDDELNFVAALSNKRQVIWQHGTTGDSDFCKIEINSFTQSVFFTTTVGGVETLVARLTGEALEIKGDMLTDQLSSSFENTVTQADPNLDRSNSTGIVEYITDGSDHFIGFGVWNAGDSKYYRVMTLGFVESSNASLAVGDYEDDATYPVATAHTFATQIETDDVSGVDTLVSGDLLRVYLRLRKFLSGAAINGTLVVSEVRTGADL